MSFEKDVDRSIDQFGDSMERGLESFFQNGVTPFFSAVSIGVKEVIKKKAYLTRRFLFSFLGIAFLTATIVILEKMYISTMYSENVFMNWLYQKQEWLSFPLAALVGLFVVLLFFRKKGIVVIRLRRRFMLAFERCGLYSKRKILRDNSTAPEYPDLYRDGFSKDGGRFFIFKNPGLPLEEWIRARESLEATLQERIAKIGLYQKNPGLIKIEIGGSDLPASVEFNETFMNHANHKSVVVGMSRSGAVTHDFESIPHLLIGGSTGAGKTVIARAIAYQCIAHLKGALYLVDFKGGADYTEFEDLGIEIISERQQVAQLLKRCMIEHKERMALFKSNRVKNIEEYNKKLPKNRLRRVFILIDEIAELTDKKGAPKDEHELLDIIVGQISSVARLARASGINLILATQRPDANVVPGQIKNNVPGRLCGFAKDDILYKIILDYIPSPRLPAPTEVKGRFIYSLGSEDYYIQTPYFQEHHVDPSIRMEYNSGVLTLQNALDEEFMDDEEISPVSSQRARYINVEDMHDE